MDRRLALVILVLVGIQFIPVDRSNPPVRSDFAGPADVHEILRRSCYACHSNATEWPWYAKVAPVSFMVSRRVNTARGELNFSEWGSYDARRQQELSVKIVEAVETAAMPPASYVLFHAEAKIVGSELQTLRAWRP